MPTRRDASRLPPLDLLAGFEAAARHLSFTLAAAECHLTQSAISRQIKSLEEDLGVPLFVRGHRSLQLTADGQRLYRSCSEVLEQLRSTVAHIRQRERRQVLSLTTTPGLASLWLIPRLPLFAKAHPGIDVRIDADLKSRDLEREGFDLAIRYLPLARAPGPALFAESLVPVCSPQLLRQGLPLKSPTDLAAHTLIDMNGTAHNGMPTEWQSWLQAVGHPDLEPASTISFNTYSEAIGAALAGHGLVLGRRPLIDALLRSRQLTRPFSDETASERGYALVLSNAGAPRPAVQALANWLLGQAQGMSSEGQVPSRRRITAPGTQTAAGAAPTPPPTPAPASARLRR
jgi:LysR family transcriptional regulator, glycine cleavage system transcriptional activator